MPPWGGGCGTVEIFWYQRTRVRIQSVLPIENFIFNFFVAKTKLKAKEARNGPFLVFTSYLHSGLYFSFLFPTGFCFESCCKQNSKMNNKTFSSPSFETLSWSEREIFNFDSFAKVVSHSLNVVNLDWIVISLF